MMRACLLVAAVGQALAQGTITKWTSNVVPLPSHNSGGSNAGSSSIASFGKQDDGMYYAVACYALAGIRCQLLSISVSASGPALTAIDDKSGEIISEIEVNSDVSSIYPSVEAFDGDNAVVCYTAYTTESLECTPLKLHLDWGVKGLYKGTPTILTTAGKTDYTNVKAFDAAGAPPSWAGRRAIVCYLDRGFTCPLPQCVVLSLTFPANTGSQYLDPEDRNQPGILTAGSPVGFHCGRSECTDILPRCPGIRFETDKALTTLDYFNGLLCYTAQVTYTSPDFPYTFMYWQQAGARCNAFSLDVITGTTLTFSESYRMPIIGGANDGTFRGALEVAVEAFKPKSGDPTRALYCFIKGNYVGKYYNMRHMALYCGVTQRTGAPAMTFFNSARTADGQASPGIEPVFIVADTSFVKEPVITAIDDYNAIVCYTIGDDIRTCPDPPTNCASGNGFHPAAGNGALTCTHVWIEGSGSSTYHTDEATPSNVGSTSRLNFGPQTVISTTATVSYPSLAVVTPQVPDGREWEVSGDGTSQIVVACFTERQGNFNRGKCSVISTRQIKGTWAFNAPVDCVNGFNCPPAPIPIPFSTSSRRELEATKMEANATATVEEEEGRK